MAAAGTVTKANPPAQTIPQLIARITIWCCGAVDAKSSAGIAPQRMANRLAWRAARWMALVDAIRRGARPRARSQARVPCAATKTSANIQPQSQGAVSAI